LIRRIGDGWTTEAWTQNWISGDEQLRPIAPRKAEALMMVSDYINHSSATWNGQKLEEFCVPMDSEIIQGIPLSH
jgi:hypothetical protein